MKCVCGYKSGMSWEPIEGDESNTEYIEVKGDEGDSATLIYNPKTCPQFGFNCSKCNQFYSVISYIDKPDTCTNCKAVFLNGGSYEKGW